MKDPIIVLSSHIADEDRDLLSLLSAIGYENIIKIHSYSDPVPQPHTVSHVIADVSNSNLSARQLVDHFRNSCHVSSVILLVSNDMEDIDTAMAAGADDVLIKNDITTGTLYKSLNHIARQRLPARYPSDTGNGNFKQIFFNNPHPMWMYDMDSHKFILVNDVAVKRYGYTREEFLDMTIHSINPCDDISKLIASIHNYKEGVFYDSGQWRHRTKNDTEFYVQVYSCTTTYEGKEVGVLVAVDIDQKVKTEQDNTQLNDLLKQQKEQMEYIFSSVNEVVWAVDPHTFQYTFINSACEKVYGYTAGQMMADTGLFFSLIHPDDLELFKAQTENVFKAGSATCEYRIIHPDGTIRYIKDEAFLKRDENGEPVVLTGLSVDVTELREKELELEERVKETESILETIADGFFILDTNWCFIYVNKAFERICNARRDDFIGQNYWEKFPRSVSLKWYPEYHRAMREQVSVHFEEYASSLDRWVSVSAYPKPDSLTVYFTDITEERKLQDKIAYNERNLQALINNTEDLIWSIDRDLKVISANESYKRSIYTLVGRPISIGESVLIPAFGEEYMQRWEMYYRKALAGTSYKVVDTITMDGDENYVEIAFHPIRNSEEVIGVSCFCRNITEERKLQERLADNERNLRSLIDNTTDYVWSVDSNLNIVTINKTFKDALFIVTGKEYDAGISIVMDDFGDDFRNQWNLHYQRALKGEKFIVVDETIYNGMPHVRETSLCPIINEQGEIIGVSCYARDITDQRRMQEEIVMNEHNMRGLINSTKDLIWSVDPTWHIISANDAYTDWMKKMNGITLREGDYALPDAFSERVKNKFIGYYKRALRGESFRITERLKPNQYDIEYIETRYNPIFDNKGNAIGVSCSTRDITETKRYQARIEAKNQSLRDIASIQSHEVRGQVATILGLAQLFNYQDPTDSINGSVLEGFLEATQNLDRIIRRIVNKTRIMDEI